MTADPSITELLRNWRADQPEAENALMDAVYPVLRELARARLRRGTQPLTLQATELANEAYARLHNARETDWQSRVHFFAISAKIIRGLVVDHVRARESEKRGGDTVLVSFDALTHDVAGPPGELNVLTVDQALRELEREDPAVAKVVELKFFSGLSTDEIADACGTSRATVVRHWRFARAWLADWIAAT